MVWWSLSGGWVMTHCHCNPRLVNPARGHARKDRYRSKASGAGGLTAWRTARVSGLWLIKVFMAESV